jgi:enterobactin synthetase component D
MTELSALFGAISPAIRWGWARPEAADAVGLPPAERARIATAGPRRRAEFATSRRLAHELLHALGIAEAAAPLSADADGLPVWPAGIVGSISHCQAACVVAVAPSDELRALGVDVELAAPLPPGVGPLVLFPGDDAFLSPRSPPADWSRALAERIVFSAKEAAYKTIFPRHRTSLDFDAMAIDGSFDPTGSAGALTATLQLDVSQTPAGTQFFGRFRVADGLIVTAFAERASRADRPVSAASSG